MSSRRDRADRIFSDIREVLVRHWDPIGVMDDPEWPRDEYDRYIGEIYRYLSRGESAEFIARHLCLVEATSMGLGELPASARITVAERLLAIDTSLGE